MKLQPIIALCLHITTAVFSAGITVTLTRLVGAVVSEFVHVRANLATRLAATFLLVTTISMLGALFP